MNLSASPMLIDKRVRPVRVEYDPDNFKNNNFGRLFMTLDNGLMKDDLVIVPTGTRHGFTIGKVVDVGFPVDFTSPDKWDWIGGKFDKASYDNILEGAKKIIARVAVSQEDKMRNELRDALGIASVDFSDVQLIGPAPVTTGSVVSKATSRTAPDPAPAFEARRARFEDDDIPL